MRALTVSTCVVYKRICYELAEGHMFAETLAGAQVDIIPEDAKSGLEMAL